MPIVLDGTAGITTPDLTDTSLTSGRVVYAGASGNLTGSTALTFDGTKLQLTGTTATNTTSIGLGGSTTGYQRMLVNNTSGGAQFGIEGSTASTITTGSSAYATVVGDYAGYPLQLITGNVVRATVDTSGNVKLSNNISVGNATPTTSGTGITFPATQSASSDANTLDDYEEGTWTPTLIDNGFNNGATLSSATGTYTKIGRCVTIQCILVMSTPCRPTTYLRTGGNPFSSSGDFAGTYTAGSVSTGRQGGFVFTVTSSLYWSQENGTTNSSAWFCTITYFV